MGTRPKAASSHSWNSHLAVCLKAGAPSFAVVLDVGIAEMLLAMQAARLGSLMRGSLAALHVWLRDTVAGC